MSQPDFTVEYLNPKDLKENPYQFRLHPDRQRTAVVASIQEFGLVDGPLVNKRTGNLIDGHLRVEEAIKEGRETMPVKVVDLSEEQERRLLRMFDPLTALATEDTETLDRLIAEINDADLERLLGDLEEGGGSGLQEGADPDEVPEKVEPRCQTGDLWSMGEHRLIVGDCTDAATVERLFAGKHLRMVWTDPPYGVSYADKNEFLNAMDRGNRNQTPIENDHMTEEATERLAQAALSLACAHGCSGASCYVACPPGTPLPHFIAAVAASGFVFKHSLAWVKNQFVLGRCDYHYRHEIILYGWKEGAHFFRDNHSQDSVFEVDKPRRSEEHPTMKPVELVRQMVENSSRPSEIVYDPFLGSGTTALACEMLGRACYGCEISEEYASVVVARWEQATGKEAKLLARSA